MEEYPHGKAGAEAFGSYRGSYTGVPTSTGRHKSYPVRVPNLSSSPTDGQDDRQTSPVGSPSYVLSPRRTLSISIGDAGNRSSSKHHHHDDSIVSSTSSQATHHQQQQQHYHHTPPMIIRPRRSSFSASSLTLYPPPPRGAGGGGGDSKDAPAPPPKRSLWQLIRNNIIQFGLEFCYATETAMVTPILLQLGLPTKLYGIAFFLAPIFGFLMNPLIGSTSDRCMCPWGRRRPFILALGIGTLVGVSLYLNGGDIGALIDSGDGSQDNLWGIIFTLIGVVILDLSADSSDGPSRAYLIDVCDLEDVNTGLNLRAILGGIGGGLGYLANGIDWTSTSLCAAMGSQLRVVFFFNVVIYTTCLLMNLTSIPEERLRAPKNADVEKVIAVANDENSNSSGVFDESSPLLSAATTNRTRKESKKRSVNGHLPRKSRKTTQSFGSGVEDQCTSTELPRIKESGESQNDAEEPASVGALLKSILHMPIELRRLCLNHYFGWAGMCTVLLFFTDFVGQAVYNGDPTAPEGSEAYNKYHEGIKMGCWGMAVFAFSSSLSAIFYMKVDHIFSHRTLYVFGQLCFAVGTGLIAVLVDYVYAVLVLCFVFGVQFTTLMTVPFNILASFHDCDSYKNPKGGTRRGLGTDVACLCCQLFLAQITISAFMGPLVSAVGSHVTVVIFASLMGFMAALTSALLVIYTPIVEKKVNTSIQENC